MLPKFAVCSSADTPFPGARVMINKPVMKQQLFIFFLIMIWLTESVGKADTSTEAAAMAAFDEGARQFREGEFKVAAASFEEAYRLRPSWKILFNIGQCRAAAKAYGPAMEAFEAYLAEGGDDVPSDKKYNVINEIRTLRELVGYVDIDATEGMTVFLDGERRGAAPLPGPVALSAGVNHQIVVMQGDEPLLDRTIRVNSGNTIRVSATSQSLGASTSNVDEDNPPPPITTAPRTKPLFVAGFVVGGVGIGALAGALATGLSALSISNDLNGKSCTQALCGDDNDRMNNLVLSTNILLGTGGVLFTAGLTMVVVAAVKKKKEREVSALPLWTSDGGGLVLKVRF